MVARVIPLPDKLTGVKRALLHRDTIAGVSTYLVRAIPAPSVDGEARYYTAHLRRDGKVCLPSWSTRGQDVQVLEDFA